MSRVWWLGCAPFVLAACGGGSDPGSQGRPAAKSAEVAKAVDKAVNADKKALASENNVANSDRRIISKAEVALIVDDQHARHPGVQSVERNAVRAHEAHQLRDGNAAVLAAGNAVAAELPAVEPLGDRAWSHLADLGDFAGRQNIF